MNNKPKTKENVKEINKIHKIIKKLAISKTKWYKNNNTYKQ